jgi:peptidoglycan/xylan/chitin deacetylase (PgdA/CDA1 family)
VAAAGPDAYGQLGLRARVKRTVLGVARRAGVGALARRANGRRLLVVCYHGVRADAAADRHWLLVPQRAFARQIEYLAACYRCLPLDEAFGELQEGRLQGPTACVTFDDGYLNNRTEALPVLERFRVPAVVYLPSGLIDRGELPWPTRLELAFRDTPAGTVDLSRLGLGAQRLGTAADRARVGREAVLALKQLSDDAATERLDELRALLGESTTARGPSWQMMTWHDVRAVGRGGLVTFGAHTVEHRILSRLGDADVEREIGDSVRAVGAATSALSRTFAYPNGRVIDFDARAQGAARRAGCIAAVSTIEGLNDAAVDSYALRRLSVGQHMALDEFALRAAGALPAAPTPLALSGPPPRPAAARAPAPGAGASP